MFYYDLLDQSRDPIVNAEWAAWSLLFNTGYWIHGNFASGLTELILSAHLSVFLFFQRQ